MIHRSVLDLSLVSQGATSGDALRDTTRLALQAEALGYHRFWVAEHHNLATVASTSPAVLIAHVAAATTRIRVGSGGVMLPNHAALVVAEQFAMLEALHPGRIDLGIGRAPGTDPATAAALRRTADPFGAEEFPRQLLDLMGLLGDRRVAAGAWDRLTATPVATSRPEVVLLGSSGYSAELAGRLGLGFAFAHHFDVPGTLEAVAWYRQHFEPSAVLDEPYAIVTAGVLAADDAEQAEYLAAPARLAMLGIRTGRRMPLMRPEDADRHPDMSLARSMPSNRIVGDAATVGAALAELIDRTAADEIMISTMTHGLAERVRTLEIVAEQWEAG
jgi:luciferase family oxidoreductase group 1